MAQFFTDFSHNTPDQTPSDWTERWSGNTGIALVRDSGIPSGGGAQALEATNDLLFSWDVPGTPSGDVDVRIKLLVDSFSGTSFDTRVFLHGSESGGLNYFAAGIRLVNQHNSLMKAVDGSGSFLSTAASSNSSNTWYWVRLNRSGNTIRMKKWEDGNTEPVSWLISTSDTDLSSGFVGIHYRNDGTLWVDEFAVGTDGDPAPTEPTQPDPPTGLSLHATGPNSIAVSWNEPD